MHSGNSGCGGYTYYFSTYFIKFETPEPDKYYIPLDMSHLHPGHTFMAFIKSSTSETDMTLDGTDNHHVFIVTGFENDYCHSYQDTSLYKAFYDSTGDIPLGTTEAEIGFKANDLYREV